MTTIRGWHIVATKLYLVSDGQYSDYKIMGIYSTRETAEEAQICYNADNDIEEFILDKMPSRPPGLFPYAVCLRNDGNPLRPGYDAIWRVSADGFEVRSQPYGYDALYNEPHPPETSQYHFQVWAKSEEHALKIANKKRAELIANNQWIIL